MYEKNGLLNHLSWKVFYITVATVLMGYGSSYGGFEHFSGDENSFSDVLAYLKKNLAAYFAPTKPGTPLSKQQERSNLKKEMERLVLKIDAGDIKNEQIRKKVVTIRRSALKNQDQRKFVIHNFDYRRKNQLGGSLGTEFAGDPFYISPWVALSFVHEAGRKGKKVLQVQYDVSEGPAAFYNEVEVHYPFKRFTALGFDIKGDIGSCVVRLETAKERVHEYTVSGVSTEWQSVVIPFESFNQYHEFEPTDITRITIVLEPELVAEVQGFLYLDDLILTRSASDTPPIVKKQILRYDVDGAVPLGTDKSLMRK